MTKRVLERGWSLSFDIKPTGLVAGWSSILHATIAGNIGRYGERTPGIWFPPNTNQLHICSPVNGNANFCFNSAPLNPKIFSRVVIRQLQKGNLKRYSYEIWINGKKIVDVVNNRPELFHNVKYYISDPWHNAAKVQLKNINVVNYPHQGKSITHFFVDQSFGKRLKN